MQFNLFKDDKVSKTIEYIPLEKLILSEFNYRKTRNKEDIERLAQRIDRNGFEITRALWVHQNNGHYEVFAGGNRMEAAKIAGLQEVPVVVHDGLTDAEIAKLAMDDNENDEYHVPVDMVDVWDYYARLYEKLGTEQAVAELLEVSQPQVSFRRRLSELPQWVKDFITKQDLNERLLREFLRLLPGNKWLTIDDIYGYILKQNFKTAAQLAKHVDEFNEFIKYTEDTAKKYGKVIFYFYEDDKPPQSYEWDAKEKYLAQLKAYSVRTIGDAKQIEYEINRRINEEQQKYADYTKQQEDESKIVEVESGDWWQLGDHLLYCGDTSSEEFVSKLEQARFVFADPPYNADAAEWDKDFEWRHDYLIDKAEIVAVTPGISSIFDFARETTMPYVWSMSCWIDNGMTRGAVGFGNWIYIALFSNGSVHSNSQDMIRVSIDQKKTNHKGTKPIELLKELLNRFTDSGDVVIDPFLGSGTTLFACQAMNRKCIGGDIDRTFCKEIIERWQNETNEQAEKIDGD